MRPTTNLALVAATLVFTATAQALTLDMIPVGNPGNAADTRYVVPGYGSVGYEYLIGKYEVTAGQYTEFLKAVADDDPNGLYNTSMTSSFGAQIQQIGSSPNYSYSVAADWANRPVNFVSFWDAARFANWLHNDQPTGPQGPGTTEEGAYHDLDDHDLFGRNPGAKFFIPTEDEWYKAAYHDQSAGLANSYFDYPTGTNSFPENDITETTNPGNNANFYDGNYTIGSPYYRTEVGEFELSDSTYGTFDQGGNINEWNEAVLFVTRRGVRGGSFGFFSNALQASFRDDIGIPTLEFSHVGFRVASLVLEPVVLIGDYNSDGKVSAADFTVWRDNIGASSLTNRDPDNAGPIGIDDFNSWKENYGVGFGNGTGSGVQVSVPEPAGLILLLSTLWIVKFRIRRVLR